MDWSILSSIASTVIALAALVFSVRSFRSQQRWSETNAQANVKPFFWLKLQGYTDLKSVTLRNDGVGPAVITAAVFIKEGRSTSRLVDLIDVDIPFWETFTAISHRRVVPAQGEIVLFMQSLAHLEGQGISDEEGLNILRRIHEARKGISIRIEYEDIYGTALEPYVEII